MKGFALVVCSVKKEEAPAKKTWLNFISQWVKSILKGIKKEDEPGCELIKLELYANQNAYIIRVPYGIQELPHLKSHQIEKVNRFIASSMEDNGIEWCILPRNMSDVCMFGNCTSSNFDSKPLFKSLFKIAIEEIFSTRGIKINELDIAIIHGESPEELSTFIRLLACDAKYITVVADNKEEVGEVVKGIYEESGLSIRVTSDFKGGLKDVDLIVNMSDLKERNLNLKPTPNAIIINYGIIDNNRIQGENIIINGLEVKPPKELTEKFNGYTRGFFSDSEISNVVLNLRYEIFDKHSDKITDINKMKSISSQVTKDGYKITGFVGRRSVLKAKDLVAL